MVGFDNKTRSLNKTKDVFVSGREAVVEEVELQMEEESGSL